MLWEPCHELYDIQQNNFVASNFTNLLSFLVHVKSIFDNETKFFDPRHGDRWEDEVDNDHLRIWLKFSSKHYLKKKQLAFPVNSTNSMKSYIMDYCQL